VDSSGSKSTSYVLYKNNTFSLVENKVIAENHACIYLNGQELVTMLCSPGNLEDLATGFLRSEEIVTSIDEIAIMSLSANKSCIDVWLKETNKKIPARRIITGGCGSSITFADLLKERPALPMGMTIEAAQVDYLMKQLLRAANLYNEVGAAHTTTLNNATTCIFVAEDIGQDNTINRLWGQALRQGTPTEGMILVCTGRVTSELIEKAAKMGVPIVISSTSPTSLAIELANTWKITVIGYARENSFRIYSVPERVIPSFSSTP